MHTIQFLSMQFQSRFIEQITICDNLYNPNVIKMIKSGGFLWK